MNDELFSCISLSDIAEGSPSKLKVLTFLKVPRLAELYMLFPCELGTI